MAAVQEIAKIVRLAQSNYNDLDNFIDSLEKTSEKPFRKRGDYFFWVGNNLFESYPYHALTSWKHASKYFIKYRDRVRESECYINLGIGYGKLAEFDTAIKYCNTGLKIAQVKGDSEKVYTCFFSLGADYYGLANFQKALDNHTKALKIAIDIEKNERNENRSRVISCYFQQAHDYEGLGDYWNSIKSYDTVLRMDEDKFSKVECCIGKGTCYRRLSEFQKAKNADITALSLVKEIENSNSQEAACYSQLGNDCSCLGDYQSSIEYNRLALNIHLNSGDEYAQAVAYNRLGSTFYNLGGCQNALENHSKALNIAERIESVPLEDRTYISMEGVVRKYYVGNRPLQRGLLSSCHGNLGNDYYMLRDLQKAKEHHNAALEKAKGVKLEEAIIFNNLGNDYQMTGDHSRSLIFHTAALEIAQSIGNRALESVCYLNLGNDHYYGSGNLIEATNYFNKALRMAETIGYLDLERLVNLSLGSIYRSKSVNAALKYLNLSIDLAEDIRANLAEEGHKISFLATEINAFELIIDIFLQFEKYELAFEYVEKSKSRALLDILASSKLSPTVGNNIKLIEEEEQILNKLNEIQNSYLRNIAVNPVPGLVKELRLKLNKIYDQLRKIDEEYVALRRATPISIDTARNVLR